MILIAILFSLSLADFQSPDGEKMTNDVVRNITTKLLPALEFVERNAGVKLRISSGYRSQAYNAKIGGVKNSEHCLGYAADVAIKNCVERYKILKFAITYPIRRIGVYSTFLHLGVSPIHPQDVIWVAKE